MKSLFARLHVIKMYFVSLLLVALLIPGCACWQPENAQDKKCIAAKITVDCTKGSAISQAPNMLPLVKWILGGAPGGQMDWQSLLKSLMHFGFEVVSCTAGQLDNALALKTAKMAKARAAADAPVPSAAEEAAFIAAKNESTTAHNNWGQFMAQNYPNIVLKMPEKNPLESLVK